LQGTITAIYDIGCFFGAIAAFFVGDILGRKKTVLAGTTIMSIGAILQITAYGVPQMIVGRIVAGIGNGKHCMIDSYHSPLTVVQASILQPHLPGRQRRRKPHGEASSS